MECTADTPCSAIVLQPEMGHYYRRVRMKRTRGMMKGVLACPTVHYCKLILLHLLFNPLPFFVPPISLPSLPSLHLPLSSLVSPSRSSRLVSLSLSCRSRPARSLSASPNCQLRRLSVELSKAIGEIVDKQFEKNVLDLLKVC